MAYIAERSVLYRPFLCLNPNQMDRNGPVQHMKKLFVGNLPWSVDDQELEEMFSSYGTVHSARVILERDTGRSRGFGFVEMDDSDADEAMNGLDGTDVGGRDLRVNEANDKKGGRGGGGGGGGRW